MLVLLYNVDEYAAGLFDAALDVMDIVHMNQPEADVEVIVSRVLRCRDAESAKAMRAEFHNAQLRLALRGLDERSARLHRISLLDVQDNDSLEKQFAAEEALAKAERERRLQAKQKLDALNVRGLIRAWLQRAGAKHGSAKQGRGCLRGEARALRQEMLELYYRLRVTHAGDFLQLMSLRESLKGLEFPQHEQGSVLTDEGTEENAY